MQEIIFVKSGALRLDKEIAIDHTNYWPVGCKNWEVSTKQTRKVRTMLKVKANQYIGAREIKEGLKYPGQLITDEDSTSLIVISQEHLYLRKNN